MDKIKKGVRLDHISKIYQDPKTGKDFYAVKDTSLTIEPGSFVTLLGPSGCGKTTTLRMIAGFESPDEGEIYLGDEPINALTPNKRDTAMVFQSYALLPHYNVFDNVAYGLKLRKVPKDEIRERVMHILDLVELTGMEGRMTNQLSGGQQQRVALARALVIEPSVLLFDEPLSNLDAKLRVSMRTEIRRIQQEVGITAIYVTHDQSEAMALSDQIIIMNKGVVAQIGTPQEVFNHPANLFVAGFIGMPQMNFYNAELVQEDGRYAVVLDRAKVFLSDEKQTKLKKNGVRPGSVTLGVRPEHLLLTGDPNAMVCGTVNVSEMMGSAVHLHISACGTDTIIIVPTAELENANNYAIGSEVSFTFSGATAHLFDRETGLNLEA